MSGERENAPPRRTAASRWGFEPLQALGDAHLLAVDTANQAFRAFSRLVDDEAAQSEREPTNRDPTREPEDPLERGGFADLRRTVTRSFDLYLELAERFFDASTRSLEDALRTRGVSVSGAGGRQSWTPLELESSPGVTATVPVWLHNQTDAPLRQARFRVTDLVSCEGHSVPGSAVEMTPMVAANLEPGASLSAKLAIEVPVATPPGVYLGYVLVAPLPEIALPVRLEVVDEPPDGLPPDRPG